MNNNTVTRLSLAQAWRIRPAFTNHYSWLLSFFVPLLFVITISSFSQERTWFPPEALILSSCIAFTADDASEHVRSPPEGKYSEQPASQAKFTTKIYLKQFFGGFVLFFCFGLVLGGGGVWLLLFNISGKYTIPTAHRLWSGLCAFRMNLGDCFSCIQKLVMHTTVLFLTAVKSRTNDSNAGELGKYRIMLSWQTAPFFLQLK